MYSEACNKAISTVPKEVTALDWSPDGKLIAAGSRKGVLYLLEVVKSGDKLSLNMKEHKPTKFKTMQSVGGSFYISQVRFAPTQR